MREAFRRPIPASLYNLSRARQLERLPVCAQARVNTHDVRVRATRRVRIAPRIIECTRILR